jgi:hypothetical protein
MRVVKLLADQSVALPSDVYRWECVKLSELLTQSQRARNTSNTKMERGWFTASPEFIWQHQDTLVGMQICCRQYIPAGLFKQSVKENKWKIL